MKFMTSFKLLLVLAISSWSFNTNGQGDKISLEISTQKDTIVIGQPVIFKVVITNIWNKNIQLTKDFNFTSNMYPNPNEIANKGATLEFEFDPNPLNKPVWAEGQVLDPSIEMQELKPKESITIEYDINKHLRDFLSPESSSVPASNYKLRLNYKLNRKHKQFNLVTGQIQSNQLTVYIKE
jgi:hypothetical protein